MTKLSRMPSLLAAIAAVVSWFGPASAQTGRSGTAGMNVLFIAVDDLRPELGSYGGLAKTPSLDRLAAEGVRFDRQFVQVPTCGASRFALLTGRYPRTTDHLSNEAFVRLLPREERATPESFAELFRRNGYRTVSIGKISHYPDGRVFTYAGGGKGELEMPLSWSEVLPWSEIEGPDRKWGNGWNAFFGYADGSNRNANRGRTPAFEHADVPDDGYPDGRIADAAVRKLRELKGERFMLAVGFFKPHLPFNAPRKYWDLYDEAEIPLSPNPGVPAGINPGSLHDSNEMFGSYAHPEKGGAGVVLSDGYSRKLRHAYLAAVSYSDAQVGRVLDELDRLGLRDNTIVVVWGDHGWHLGDQTIWGKHSTFERALRSPLLVRVPGVGRAGSTAEGIVEAVDIYPTLAELAGLRAPEGLDGRSFVPLIRDPAAPGKDAAYSRWTARRTLRTDRYRIVLHEKGEPRIELFDHRADPLETRNVAAERPDVVKRLLAKLERYP